MEIVTLAIILRMSCEPAGEPLHEHCSAWTEVRPRGGASYTRDSGQEIRPGLCSVSGSGTARGLSVAGQKLSALPG